VVAVGRTWYLVAHDQDRADWRSFRVDRIRDARPTPGRFTPRPLPAEDVGGFVRARLEDLAPTYEAFATVHASASEVRRRVPIGSGAVEPVAAQRSTVRLASDTLDWLAFRLLGIGSDFQVHEPPELVGHLRRLADRLSRTTATAPRRKAGVGTRLQSGAGVGTELAPRRPRHAQGSRSP
jgi:predicted DNA-binding transcriptional regulator YafY